MLETLLTIVSGAFLGVVAWAFQMSNRVSILETQREDLVELIETKFDEVNRRLDRIERNQMRDE